MKENLKQMNKRLCMSEYSHFNGEYYITFNIVCIDTDKNEITVAVSNQGKVSIVKFDLVQNKNGCLYFEYGRSFDKISLDDFE